MSIHLAPGFSPQQRHACALFDGVDEEYAALVPFVREGFARGERAYHVVDSSFVDEHLRRLEHGGIDVVAAGASGQLAIGERGDTYIHDGRFDQDATIALIEDVLKEGRALGFPATRLIGFGGGSLLAGPYADDFVRYESRINRMLSRYGDPVVCSYQRPTFG